MSNLVHEYYGNRLRIRVCGLCVVEDALLLVSHRLLNASNKLWIPPGGGMMMGESATDCLIREFEEETGLKIEPEELLFTSEVIKPPLHALELFFQVSLTGGDVKTGIDSEISEQIIEEVKFVSWKDLAGWKAEDLHGIFQKVQHPSKIMGLRGYFKL